LKKLLNTGTIAAGRRRGGWQTEMRDRAALPDTRLSGAVPGARAADGAAVVGQAGPRTGGFAQYGRARCEGVRACRSPIPHVGRKGRIVDVKIEAARISERHHGYPYGQFCRRWGWGRGGPRSLPDRSEVFLAGCTWHHRKCRHRKGRWRERLLRRAAKQS
jgi:hypothetical protein